MLLSDSIVALSIWILGKLFGAELHRKMLAAAGGQDWQGRGVAGVAERQKVALLGRGALLETRGR